MPLPVYWIPNPMISLPTQIVCIDCKKGVKCKGTMVTILAGLDKNNLVKYHLI